MKKGLTEVVFILDKSGSMCGLEKDTIGGYNAFLNKQRKIEGEALITTVIFSDSSSMIHDRVSIKDVKNLTEEDYSTDGCTALLDAVGNTVKHIEKIHRYAREEDVPEKTIFVITTDGEENSSREYTWKNVKDLISKKQEQNHWEFIFLGANIDAAETAGNMGICSQHAVDYCCDSVGVEKNFEAVSNVVECCRAMELDQFEQTLADQQMFVQVREHLEKNRKKK